MTHTLYIGPKNYSSWSLRPWLVLKWAGIAFNEHPIALDRPGYGEGRIADVVAVSPNGLVPALHVDGHVIWDTLAIAEWAHEQIGNLWPADAWARAHARSATAEMHSGFAPVRRDLPMNILRRCPEQDWLPETRRSIDRICALWTDCRGTYGADGPWLFGERSIADAFYAPIATRFRTYSVTLDAISAAYVDTLMSDTAFREWEAACIPDSWDASGFSVIDGVYR
jgi:glutathione S-transferase